MTVLPTLFRIAVVVFVLFGMFAFGLFIRLLLLPSMDSFGEINECIGCSGQNNEDMYCVNCDYWPEYWRYDPGLCHDKRKPKAERKRIKRAIKICGSVEKYRVVVAVINGYYDRGESRKGALEESGYDYNEIQLLVNRVLIDGANKRGKHKWLRR